MEGITANELAGFGVGTLLLCATIAAPKIDALISASQRRSLGMCKKCGDLKIIACSRCKGVGSVRVVGPFSYSPVDDIYQLLGGSAGGSATKVKSLSCGNCQAKGHMCCPICSEVP